VRRFAETQKSTMKDVELEVRPGLIAGQKAIPVNYCWLLRAGRAL
jgi:sulfopropanediol 3-dehydrogenase